MFPAVRILIRRLTVAACLAAAVGGCALIPDDVADPARGAGVSAALTAQGSARAVADRIDARVPATCRVADLEAGPVTVEADVTWTLKRPGLRTERIAERHLWRRDAEGDVASAQTVETLLPDGRATHRSREDRVVAGAAFAAIDGRFARADRIPELPARALDAAFEGVDSLLALIAVDDHGRIVPAGDGRPGLCAVPSERRPQAFEQELEAWTDAAVHVSPRARRGWLRWEDSGGATLTVTFSERQRATAPDVEVPERLWPVEADRAYHRAETFAQRGVRDGWLRDSPLAPEGSADPGAATGGTQRP